MTLATITWSDGDSATIDMSIDAIKFYQDLGNVSVVFLPDEQPVITEPTPTPTPTPSTQDPITDTTQNPVAFIQLILINPGPFTIKNDRVVGEVLYAAIPDFHDSHARAIMTVNSLDNVNLVTKTVTLNFTSTERDERIFFDESAFGEQEVRVELFVWEFTEPVILATKKTFNVTKFVPQIPQDFRPPGDERPGVAGTPFGVAAVGLLGLGILGALGVGGKKKNA